MNAAELISDLRGRNPAAVDLASLCALALSVEPRLLRRLRLLLPGSDVSAETDLWSSSLVARASVTGLSLRRDVAEYLASDLRRTEWNDLRERALELIDGAHAGASWSVRLSEQLARVAVTERPDVRTRELVLAGVRQLLAPDASPPERQGIARWLLAALSRLPRDLLSSEAAQAAGLAANLHLAAGVLDTVDPIVQERWMPYLLRNHSKTVDVEVGLRAGQLEINGVEPDRTLHLPDTDPLVLDLEWNDGTSAHAHRLRLTPGERVSVPIRAAQVDVRTLTGAGIRLSRPTGASRQGGFDFTAEWARHRPCLGVEAELDEAVDRVVGGQSVMITGGRGTGKTTFACAVAERLIDRGTLVLAHFCGVEPSWDEPSLVAESLRSQAQAAASTADTPVVVLIDDAPGNGLDWARSVSGRPGPFLVTGFSATAAVDTGRLVEPVCAAMVAAAGRDLIERLDGVTSTELIGLVNDRPSLLARLIEWIMAQPAPVQVSDLPPTVTAVGFAQAMAQLAVGSPDLSDSGSSSDAGSDAAFDESVWLAEAALASSGCTVANLARTVAHDRDGEFAGFLRLADSQGLLTLDGPARTPDGVWLPTAVRPAIGLADAVADWFGPQILVQARRELALGAVDPDAGVRGASAYQIAHGVATIRAAEADGLSAELRAVLGTRPSAAFLHRRAVQDGVDAAVADLERLTYHTEVPALLEAARFVASALAPVPSERFADFVLNEMRRRGHGEGTIGRFIDPAWPPLLAVRSTEAVPPLPARAGNVNVALVSAGAWLAEGVISFADGRDSIALPPDLGQVVRIADRAGVVAIVLFRPDATSPRLLVLDIDGDGLEPLTDDAAGFGLPSSVTSLVVTDTRVIAGFSNGMAMTYPHAVPRSVGAKGRSAIDPDAFAIPLLGHGAAVTALAQPSPLELATASLDGTVRIWDLPSGRTTATLRHPAGVRHLVAVGQLLVTADETGTVRWWRDGVALAPPFAHAGPVVVLLATDDGSVISCATDGSIVSSVVRPDGLVEATHWAGTGSTAVQLALADEKLVITYHDDSVLRWWYGGRVDGQQTVPRVVHGLFKSTTPGQVLVVDADGPMVTALPGGSVDASEQTLRSIAVGINGSVAVGTARTVWSSYRPGHGHWAPSGPQTAHSLAFLGADLLVAWADGSATREDDQRLGSGDLVAGSPTRGAVVSEQHLQILGPQGEHIVALAGILRPGEKPTALTAADEDVWVGTSRGRLLCFADQSAPTVETTLPAPVSALAGHGRGALVGMADGLVYLVDDARSALVARHDGRVNGVVSAGGRALTASADRTLRLWDVEHATELGRLAHTSAFTAVAAHPDPGRVIARTADGLVWVVDVDLGEPTSPSALFDGAETIDIVNTTGESFGLAVRLRPAVPVEVRRIEVAPKPSAAPVVSLDSAGRYAEPLFADGRLVSTRRTGPDEALTLRVWVPFPVGPTVTIRLGVVTADRADELTYSITFSRDTPLPPLVAYLGQEEPPDVQSTSPR